MFDVWERGFWEGEIGGMVSYLSSWRCCLIRSFLRCRSDDVPGFGSFEFTGLLRVYEFNWFVTCIGRLRSTGKKWVFLHQLALLDALNAFFFGLSDSGDKSYDILTPVSYDRIYLLYCISKVSSRIPNLTFRCRISNSDVSPRGLPLRTSSQMEISILRTWSCESCDDASVHDVKKLEAILESNIRSACFFSIQVYQSSTCWTAKFAVLAFFLIIYLTLHFSFLCNGCFPTSRIFKKIWEVLFFCKCGWLHVI